MAGLVYSLNMTMSFNEATNLTSLFKSMSKPTSNNFTSNFNIDGTMFMNDDEFILYIMGTMIPNRPTSFSMLMDVRGLKLA